MAEDFEVGGPLPEESSNRTFLIAAAGIGGLLVLSMICLGVYALVLAPRQQQARVEQATQIVLQNTQVAQSLTQTAAAGRATQTPTPSETPVPNTPTATATQVVVIPTDTPFTTFGTSAPLTSTAAAQQTLDAAQQTTPTATPTALPATGFADEAGLPTLFLLALGLLAVVIVARGIRTRTS
jgi:type II secretory pathway pseudopilin PulG